MFNPKDLLNKATQSTKDFIDKNNLDDKAKDALQKAKEGSSKLATEAKVKADDFSKHQGKDMVEKMKEAAEIAKKKAEAAVEAAKKTK